MRRLLKRWRWVGIFDEHVMLCAADVHVGPLRQSFWVALDRTTGRLIQRTRLLPRHGALELSSGRLHLNDSSVRAELTFAENHGIETTCGPVWTRKQAGVRATGTLALGKDREQRLDALAVIDDTAGYHPRVTAWRWAAGVGKAPDGAALAFNLVEGVNDPPSGSERAVWVDGAAHEAPPVSFTESLGSILCEDGSTLSFSAEATRARRDNLLLVRSDYHSELGVFTGTLPGGIELEHGLGVVERHRAHW